MLLACRAAQPRVTPHDATPPWGQLSSRAHAAARAPRVMEHPGPGRQPGTAPPGHCCPAARQQGQVSWQALGVCSLLQVRQLCAAFWQSGTSFLPDWLSAVGKLQKHPAQHPCRAMHGLDCSQARQPAADVGTNLPRLLNPSGGLPGGRHLCLQLSTAQAAAASWEVSIALLPAHQPCWCSQQTCSTTAKFTDDLDQHCRLAWQRLVSQRWVSCRSKSSALPPGNAFGSLLSPEAWQTLPDGLLLPHLADGTAIQVPEQDAAAVYLQVGRTQFAGICLVMCPTSVKPAARPSESCVVYTL